MVHEPPFTFGITVKIDRRRAGPPLSDRAQTSYQRVIRSTTPNPKAKVPFSWFECRASVVDHCSESESYHALLDGLKRHIRTSQLRAALAVNQEMIMLYWHIG